MTIFSFHFLFFLYDRTIATSVDAESGHADGRLLQFKHVTVDAQLPQRFGNYSTLITDSTLVKCNRN